MNQFKKAKQLRNETGQPTESITDLKTAGVTQKEESTKPSITEQKEIQQNSNITYRLFDWNRVDKYGKSRELHIEKAIENIKFSKKAKKYQSNSSKGTSRIIKNKFFDVKKIVVKDKFESSSNINTLLIMNVIKGSGKIYDSNNEYILNKGDTFIIPATMGKYKIIGNLEMIRTSLVKEKIKVEKGYNI